ncbi:MAG: EthD domain-containing protein [Candidatus Azotimanducaceae bacterium]
MTTSNKNPLIRMNYLIRRRQNVSREELLVHWFANHMPAVIKGQADQKKKGKEHAHKYLATVFEEVGQQIGEHWDGMAQLWWNKELPTPDESHGTYPVDTFQEVAEPYSPWATQEYLVIDGNHAFRELTLNDAFPTTSSEFFKVTFLVSAKEGIDYDQLFQHWLGAHAANAKSVLEKTGGFRYVIGLSTQPKTSKYVGMAELYFSRPDQFLDFNKSLEPDGMEKWIDAEKMSVLVSTTKMIGIP